MENTIQFTVLENNTKHIINTYFGEYRDLMTLLRDQLFLDGFGECGGVGRCATCVIKIKGLTGDSLLKERNEPATLLKTGLEGDDIRLSCQILVTKNLNGCEVEILEMEH